MFDNRDCLDLQCFEIFFSNSIFLAEAPDKKSMNLLVEIFQLVPVAYIEGGKHIVLSDLVRCHCPPALSLLPPIKEVCEAFGVIKNNYLARLNELHSRYAYSASFTCKA